MLFQRLKALDVSLLNMDEALEYLSGCTALIQTAEQQGVEPRPYLVEQRKRLQRRIRDLDTDRREHELAKVRAEIALRQSDEVKLQKLFEKEAALEASLVSTAG